MARTVLVLMLAMIARTAVAQQTGFPDTIAKSTENIRKIMEANGVQGASVALLSGERIVWQQGFGWADREKAIPVTPETTFHVGSVSKMFATTAALILVDEGKLDLDAPLVQYLPDFRMRSAGYERITVRMLLNHQSGLPGAYYSWAGTTSPVNDFNRRMFDWLTGEYSQQPPGYYAIYTNNGFDVVEKIVATISGKSYAQFVKDRILMPLGMTHSGVDWIDTSLQATLSRSYATSNAATPEFLNMLGTGGFTSTPTDMCRLLAMYNGRGTAFGATVLKPASVLEMEKDSTLKAKVRIDGASLTPGLGWDLYADPVMSYAGQAPTKGGDSLLFGTQILTMPSRKLAVTAMVNVEASWIARTMAEQVLQAAIQEQDGIEPPAPIEIAEAVTPSFDLNTLKGTYGSAAYTTLWDLRTDGSSIELWARRGDLSSSLYSNLKPRRDGWFASDSDHSKQFRVATYDGRDVLLMRSNQGHSWAVDAIGERLAAAPVLSAAWKARVGKTWVAVDQGMVDYYFNLRALGMRLMEREGRLVTERYVSSTPSDGHLTDGSTPLDPLSDSLARTPLQIDCRDLTHFQVIQNGGEEWIRTGTGPSLWRPIEGIPAPQGNKPYTASIVPDRAEWVKLPVNSAEYVLSAPDNVHWALYNDRLLPIFDAWGGAWRIGLPEGSSSSTLYLALYSMTPDKAVVQRLSGKTFSSASGVKRISK